MSTSRYAKHTHTHTGRCMSKDHLEFTENNCCKDPQMILLRLQTSHVAINTSALFLHVNMDAGKRSTVTWQL